MLLSNIPQSLVIHTQKKWNESWESLVNMILVPNGPKTAHVLRVSSKHACVDKLTSLGLDSPRPIGGKKCVIIGLNGWWLEFAPFDKLALKLLLEHCSCHFGSAGDARWFIVRVINQGSSIYMSSCYLSTLRLLLLWGRRTGEALILSYMIIPDVFFYTR